MGSFSVVEGTRKLARRLKHRQPTYSEPEFKNTKPTNASTPKVTDGHATAYSCVHKSNADIPVASSFTNGHRKIAPTTSTFPPEAPIIQPDNDDFGPLVTPDSRSDIEKLPPGLYAHLLNRLTPPEGVLLSLTCKQLWSQVTLRSSDVLHRMKRCSSLDDVKYLLTRIERDNSSLILCSVCLRLHKRLIDEQDAFLNRKEVFHTGRNCTDSSGAVELGPIHYRYKVYREAVESILRAASLGGEFDLHSDALKHSAQWKAWSKCPVSVSWECECLVIESDGDLPNLFVCTKYQTEIDLRRPISEEIQAGEIRGCGHKDLDEKRLMRNLLREAERTHDTEAREGRDTTEPQSPLRNYHQCPRCPTDMEASVKKKPGEVFAMLTVTAWRDPGTSGDHMATQWLQQVCYYSSDDFSRHPAYAYGSEKLKDVYEKHKGPRASVESD